MIDFTIFGNGILAQDFYNYLRHDSYKAYVLGDRQVNWTTSKDEGKGYIVTYPGESIIKRWFMDRYKGLTVNADYVKVQPWDHIKTQWVAESMDAFPKPMGIFLPIGYNKCNSLREKIFNDCFNNDIAIMTFIHDLAYMAHGSEVGIGSIILEHSRVQTRAKMGKSCILWSNVHLGHGSELEDFCFISTGTVISGGCKIGHNSFLGINTSIKDGVEIAPNNVIGMGAVITKSTKPYEVYLAGVNNKYHKRSDEI
jgi:UDP-3-O-[3-hydroxymyristoyl] glucosamine N-acyltransferase